MHEFGAVMKDAIARRERDAHRAARRERGFAAASFAVTCGSVFLVRWWGQWSEDPVENVSRGYAALGFTGVLMGVLLAHELGHWGVARAHRIALSLPFFLPAPFLTGTFGAIIRLDEPPRGRDGLAEMGAAGPLAGFLALLLASVAWVLRGPVVVDGDHVAPPPLLVVLSVFTGRTAPTEIAASDGLGYAVWLGCLLTAMNLLPIGQLDGGHVVRALIPRWTGFIRNAALLGLVLLGWCWPMWAVWALVILAVGAWRSLDVRDDPPPSGRAVAAGVATLIAFGLCFHPVPV
jgi:membrane-associated protease RseP (regulator of RpoE activity)